MVMNISFDATFYTASTSQSCRSVIASLADRIQAYGGFEWKLASSIELLDALFHRFNECIEAPCT
jgi:hypothetical protein